MSTSEVISLQQPNCFVVMPFGRTPKEIKWFQGWYEIVIEPAIKECGYKAILSAAQEQPEAINDEIRRHLIFDPMVIVDLGGIHPEDPPNPNVMYELGIRHAFGLPVVLLAWETQQLPFDISNQRAIMGGREMLDIGPTRAKIVSFVKAATEGRYYNPMEAVGRRAKLDTVSKDLGQDSVLKSLVDEIKDLKQNIPRKPQFKAKFPGNRISDYLTKNRKRRIKEALLELGFPSSIWQTLIAMEIPFEIGAEARQWETDWISYLWIRAQEISSDSNDYVVATASFSERIFKDDDSFLEKVAGLLPEQPWPKQVHKMVASSLSVPNGKVSRAINELVRRKRFLPQIDGQVFEPRTPSSPQ